MASRMKPMPKMPVVGNSPPFSKSFSSLTVNFLAFLMVSLAMPRRLRPPSPSESEPLKSTASESSSWLGSLPAIARRRDMRSSCAAWACLEISSCALLSPLAKRCMVFVHFVLAFLCRISRICARFFSYSCLSAEASSGFSVSSRSSSASRSRPSALRWIRRYVFDLILFTRRLVFCSRSIKAFSLATCWICFSSRILGFTGRTLAPFTSSSVAPEAFVRASSSFSKSSIGLKVPTMEAVETALWSSTSPRTIWSALRICWICGIHLPWSFFVFSYWAARSSRLRAGSETGSGSFSVHARPSSCFLTSPKEGASAMGAKRSSTVTSSPTPPAWNSDSGRAWSARLFAAKA
mmetsp:Transcript_144410/g.462712  ORF Transcript_144410/g.462712 Transcript_144410/m.462712 type:complete len:350 (-) Transcript_144410:567-1616(-)